MPTPTLPQPSLSDRLPWKVRFKLWNRARLRRDRIRRLLRTDPPHRDSVVHPEQVQTLLFIEAQEGWGDFLYYLGLLKALHEAGVVIDIVSLPETYKRYEDIPFVHHAYSLGSETDRAKIAGNHYDEAIDVTYVSDIHWDVRQPVLASLRCHTITVSDIVRQSKLFDEFVDLGTKEHWQDRNALMYDAILHPNKPSGPIPPFYSIGALTPTADAFITTWDEQPHVYVNTAGRVEDRTLTREQVQALVDLFNQRKTAVGVFFSQYPLQESNWVKKLPTMPFADFTSVVKACRAIITPDTSAVHLGSAFNIPVLGIYCGNNRDYWPQYSMQDVWAPISKHSVVFCEDDPGVTMTSDFIYTHRKKPLSIYASYVLAAQADSFLSGLSL